jgi:hypothetical protein
MKVQRDLCSLSFRIEHLDSVLHDTFRLSVDGRDDQQSGVELRNGQDVILEVISQISSHCKHVSLPQCVACAERTERSSALNQEYSPGS